MATKPTIDESIKELEEFIKEIRTLHRKLMTLDDCTSFFALNEPLIEVMLVQESRLDLLRKAKHAEVADA